MLELIPTVTEGDVVLTPYGEAPVVNVDFMTMTFMTQSEAGILLTWRLGDVEAMPKPDLGDVESVEKWLRCSAQVVPGVTVRETTTRCTNLTSKPIACDCLYCHTIVRQINQMGGNAQVPLSTRVEVQHMADNLEVCICSIRDCPCTWRGSWAVGV